MVAFDTDFLPVLIAEAVIAAFTAGLLLLRNWIQTENTRLTPGCMGTKRAIWRMTSVL